MQFTEFGIELSIENSFYVTKEKKNDERKQFNEGSPRDVMAKLLDCSLEENKPTNEWMVNEQRKRKERKRDSLDGKEERKSNR